MLATLVARTNTSDARMNQQFASFHLSMSFKVRTLVPNFRGLSPPVGLLLILVTYSITRLSTSPEAYRCLPSKMLLDSTTSQLTNDGERSPASGSTSMFANPSTQTTHLSLQEGGENGETRLSAPTGLGTYAEPTPQGVGNQATGKQKRQPSLAVIACRQW